MQLQKIPTIPGEPIFGHARYFRHNPLGLFQDLAKRGLPLYRLRFFGASVLVAVGPQAVYEILVQNAKSFEKSLTVQSFLYRLVGRGLFTSEKEIWRPQRKLMAPLFQPTKVAKYADCMYQCAERCIDAMHDGTRLDIAQEMTRITMSIVGKTLFDSDTFHESDALGAAMHTALLWIQDRGGSPSTIARSILLDLLYKKTSSPSSIRSRLFRFVFDPPLLPTQENKAYQEALALLDQKIAQMIEQRRGKEHEHPDLLSKLLGARDEETGGQMTDKQVRDEAMTLFLAGHETTANALTWCLYLLSEHPEKYRILQTEIDALGEAPITIDSLSSLPYTLQVFKEALRMYPPVASFDRQSREEVEIGGYTIPSQTMIFLSPYSLHHNPHLYPEPERFLPERFSPEEEEKRPRYSYLPFGAGPRICIGNHFALMEGQIVLASLLRRIRFEREPEHKVEIGTFGILKPRNGLPVRVYRRTIKKSQDNTI